MNKIVVIGGIAVLVLLLARKAGADPATSSSSYVMNPQNWRTLPGYVAAQGGGVML